MRRTFEAGKWGLPVHGFNPIKYGDLTIEEMVKRIERIDPKDDKFETWAEFSYVELRTIGAITRYFCH